jgi:hypothetical protein
MPFGFFSYLTSFPFFNLFWSSDDDQKQQQELQDNIQRDLSFENFISDNYLTPFFMEFLKDEYAEELLLFVIDVQNYKKMNLEERLQQKIKIHENYLRTNESKFEITIPFKESKKVLDEIKRQNEENLAEENLFDDVYRYVTSKALRDNFLRFKSSKIYLKLEKKNESRL